MCWARVLSSASTHFELLTSHGYVYYETSVKDKFKDPQRAWHHCHLEVHKSLAFAQLQEVMKCALSMQDVMKCALSMLGLPELYWQV